MHVHTCQGHVYLMYHAQSNDVNMHGMHAGLFSWWAMQGGPGKGVPSQVWALEPMPANLARLQANLKLARLTQQVSMKATDSLPAMLARNSKRAVAQT